MVFCLFTSSSACCTCGDNISTLKRMANSSVEEEPTSVRAAWKADMTSGFPNTKTEEQIKGNEVV